MNKRFYLYSPEMLSRGENSWKWTINAPNLGQFLTKMQVEIFTSIVYAEFRIQNNQNKTPNQTDNLKDTMECTAKISVSKSLTPCNWCLVRFNRDDSSGSSVCAMNGCLVPLVYCCIPHHCLFINIKAASRKCRWAQIPPLLCSHITKDFFVHGNKIWADGCSALA